MIMKRPIDFTIRSIPMESLKRYYEPEEITGYCKLCPRYSLNWSCPPHDFCVTDYIEQYSIAHVIGAKVYLSGFSEKTDSIDYYYDCRRSINSHLLQHETEISDSVILIAGHCDLCDDCTRGAPTKCKFPDKKRHSFESLGFKVSRMIEDLFDDKLQWDKGKTPDSLYVVAGILSGKTLNVQKIKKVFAGS
jgi:predicted metal-binding protein